MGGGSQKSGVRASVLVQSTHSTHDWLASSWYLDYAEALSMRGGSTSITVQGSGWMGRDLVGGRVVLWTQQGPECLAPALD